MINLAVLPTGTVNMIHSTDDKSAIERNLCAGYIRSSSSDETKLAFIGLCDIYLASALASGKIFTIRNGVSIQANYYINSDGSISQSILIPEDLDTINEYTMTWDKNGDVLLGTPNGATSSYSQVVQLAVSTYGLENIPIAYLYCPYGANTQGWYTLFLRSTSNTECTLQGLKSTTKPTITYSDRPDLKIIPFHTKGVFGGSQQGATQFVAR